MSQLRRSISLILLTIAIPFILVALFVFTASAASRRSDEAGHQAQSFIDSGSTNTVAEMAVAMDELAQVQILAAGQTTLTVTILSSPNAIYHKSKPGPNAFVVQALVTNTGSTTATNVNITLDYNEDPLNNWELLSGEDPDRNTTEIAPGVGVHNYWFATYPTSTAALIFPHTYTVTAQADNATLVSTSDNFYGNPSPGATVQAENALGTGNNSTLQATSDIALGVAFTVSVNYDISPGADSLIFSPVGNTDFSANSYRMIASSVRLLSNSDSWDYTDQLYIPSVPPGVNKAEARYIFIAVAPTDTRLCAYMAVDSTTNIKYDGNYCDIDLDTVIVITGSTDISFTKQASDLQVQQNETLTYTLDYANNGDLAANLVFQTLMTYLAYFYTDIYGLEANHAFAIILSVGLVAAFGFNPIIGAIADRTSSKWGKFRPWILYTAVPLGVMALLAFSTPDFEYKGKVIYAVVTYTLLLLLYAANNLPYSALSGVITGDMGERNSMSSYRFVAVMFAQFFVQVFMLPIIESAGGGDKAVGVLLISSTKAK